MTVLKVSISSQVRSEGQSTVHLAAAGSYLFKTCHSCFVSCSCPHSSLFSIYFNTRLLCTTLHSQTMTQKIYSCTDAALNSCNRDKCQDD